MQVFNSEGHLLQIWSGFYKPMDLCEDASGYLYVSDQIPRLSQLDPAGNLIGRARPAWNVPHGIACGPDGVMYVAEMNPSSLTRLYPISEQSKEWPE